jgi:class 3 adenylate cyclase
MRGNPTSEPAATCPACRRDNPPGAKFCQQCGVRLPQRCAGCRGEIAAEAKFCHRCGRAVDAADRRTDAVRPYTPRHLADEILTRRSALEGEHKQVTVLFADVKGSMALAEQVDPEDWHGILDDFFRILADGIHRFEGTVNQYTGDGIMALFGAPIAHEDHALRACSAALYLRGELRRQADRLRVARGLNFGVRIGLNSGEVVVGKIGDDLRMDYTAQGRTVGLAARMEQLAESGCVYITEHTARLIEGFFKVRDLGTSAVKGVRRPLRIYELAGVRHDITRIDMSRQRGLSRFVGRGSELAALQAGYRRVLEGRGQVVGVVGEPGVGKSRLCYEFLETIGETEAAICQANCASHIQSVPLLPVLQLLRSIFGISEQERQADTRKKVAGTLVLLDETFNDTLPVWFDFLAVADPQQPVISPESNDRQRELFAMIQRLVQSLSRQAPLVILVDDLHWIDPSSDMFIARLVDAVGESRIFLLLNFRPEYHRDWMTRSLYRRFPLAALDRDGAAELLDDLLGPDPSTQDLAPRLLSRALGNPFFIEELIRSLAEAGSLAGQPGAYRLVNPVETRMLPRTVQTVLAARIDRLGESAKQVLQTGSVIGQEFEQVILGRTANLSGGELDDSLRQLREVEFFYQKAFFPEPVYAFRHPIVREVAYHSLLGKPRAKIHRRAARAIESVHGDRGEEFAGLLAHHWEKAGEPLEAARWHARAARAAGFAEIQSTYFHWSQALKLARQGTATEEALKLQLEACCGALDIGGRGGKAAIWMRHPQSPRRSPTRKQPWAWSSAAMWRNSIRAT